MGFEPLFESGWKFPLTREDVFQRTRLNPIKKRREKEPTSGDSLSPALSSRQRTFAEADDSDLNRTASS